MRAQTALAPFLQLEDHSGSEITGPAFSPDGKGVTFEVTGPFR